MKKAIRIFLPLLSAFATLLAGCGHGGERAYFNGRLTVRQDSVYFEDWANYITLRVGEESLRKLDFNVGQAGREDASYWVEFYGHTEDLTPKGVFEETPLKDIVVHIDKLTTQEPRDPMPAELIIAGFYECLIDGVKQQLVVYSNYTYMWTVYPGTKYEIVIVGSWQRTADKQLLLKPFEEQPDFSGPPAGMTYMGTVDYEKQEVYFDSAKVSPSMPEPTEIDESGLSDEVRRSRERNRQMIAEEEARRRATPPPGITRFEFDPGSQALIEKQMGNPVFWKVSL